jgi:hypothetical protein
VAAAADKAGPPSPSSGGPTIAEEEPMFMRSNTLKGTKKKKLPITIFNVTRLIVVHFDFTTNITNFHTKIFFILSFDNRESTNNKFSTEGLIIKARRRSRVCSMFGRMRINKKEGQRISLRKN